MGFLPGYTAEDHAERRQLEDRLLELKRQEKQAKYEHARSRPERPQERARLANIAIADAERLKAWRISLNRTTMALSSSVADAEHTLSESLIKLLRLDPDTRLSVPGTWTCQNDIGTCIYDDDVDPMHDDCLICHDPQERK